MLLTDLLTLLESVSLPITKIQHLFKTFYSKTQGVTESEKNVFNDMADD